VAVDVDLNGLCVSVSLSNQLCITFPGGAEVCAQQGLDLGDPGAITRSFFGTVNTVLAPFVPLFNVIDCVLAVVECVKAIPDALSVPPDPTKIFDCIPSLLEAVAKIVGIPLAIPVMIKQIVEAIIQGVLVILAQLEAFIDYELDILAAETAAALPGNVVLQAILDCEKSNYDLEIANANESMKPLNRMIGVVNLLLLPLTGQELPTFGDLGADAKSAIDAIQSVLELIQQIAATLPG